jgi:hypothetical protein
MGRSSLLMEQERSMNKRCAGLAALLLLLGAIGLGNPYMNFGGVIDPRLLVTRIDSVKLVSPDMFFLTPDWGTHLPYDTFVFTVDFPPWPESIKLYGTAGPFPANTTIPHPKLDTWYRIGFGTQPPLVKFCACPGYPDPSVEESKTSVERHQYLDVSPSVVTGQMAVRLQPVGAGRPVVEIHDAVGNVVRSLDCTAGTSGVATATWNREDEFGRLVPEGAYFCRYAGADVIAVKKVLVAH